MAGEKVTVVAVLALVVDGIIVVVFVVDVIVVVDDIVVVDVVVVVGAGEGTAGGGVVSS